MSPVASFNLVIEILLISREVRQDTESSDLSFNLVIEILLISSERVNPDDIKSISFNLVIEILLISRTTPASGSGDMIVFQSRNRDTSNFKRMHPAPYHLHCLFQSRNRDTSNFKSKAVKSAAELETGFNLVIEILLISRK